MNEMSAPSLRAPRSAGMLPRPAGRFTLLWFALPLLALLAAAAWLINSNWLSAFENGAPPVETLTFERTILDGQGIHLKVRAGGSAPVTIAQVQVDGAYWSFTQEPAGPLSRMSTAWVQLPYPWVLGEKHEIKVLSKTGVAFKKEIEVAVATPQASAGQLGAQALLGIFVGVVPVVIGMLFYPSMRGMGGAGINFVLALTIGLLAFLFVGSLKEAFELAEKAAAAFQGTALVLAVALTAFLLLLVAGRRHGAPTGFALAGYIALGIGLHNFGEGLAIGAAFAAGVAGLGVFLVLGFTLHNVTEGIGIVAPLLRSRPSLPAFAGLALLAGVPAIFGIWLGSLSYSPQWSAVALAVGAGAILQVVVEVGAYLIRNARETGTHWISPLILLGLTAGLAVMYVTGLLVKI